MLHLHLADDDAKRVRELSGKANAGSLSADEEKELDYYVNVGRALEFLKVEARLSPRDGALSA